MCVGHVIKVALCEWECWLSFCSPLTLSPSRPVSLAHSSYFKYIQNHWYIQTKHRGSQCSAEIPRLSIRYQSDFNVLFSMCSSNHLQSLNKVVLCVCLHVFLGFFLYRLALIVSHTLLIVEKKRKKKSNINTALDFCLWQSPKI